MTEYSKNDGLEPQKIETCLSPDFDHLPPEQIYKEYEMEVPEEVLEFCRLIEDNGGKALLVGGCVRDMIISSGDKKNKLIPKDIDIEVYGIYPQDLLNFVKDKFVPVGKGDTVGNKFELITVKSKTSDFKFDISIPREDNKTGVGNKGFETSSHPEFSIKEGARRRDVTCNSMAYDPLIKITYDPYNGRRDILDGVLRATDEEKFIEDPVRILRLMRFAARYDWKVAPETEALCIWMMDKREMAKRKFERAEEASRNKKYALKKEILSKSATELDDEVKERIYLEFTKMFIQGGKPSVGLEFAKRVHVIDRYFPWLAELTVTEQEPDWHPEGNAWKHTLQVIDVAAEIAKREMMSDVETMTLVMSALDHDLGKPTKTEKKLKKDKNGELREVITSDGHDMEGGWLSTEFINAFAPKNDEMEILRDDKGDYVGLNEVGFENDLKARVKILTERHMQIKMLYLIYKDEVKKNSDKAERNARKSLGRLARKLAESGTNIYMLSFLTEADQRGRNGKSDNPLKRDEVEDLENWQTWMNEMMKEVKIEKELPKKIVDGEIMKKTLEMKQGVELGVIDSWVFDDQLASEFVEIEEGLAKAAEYKELVLGAIEVAKSENWKPTFFAARNRSAKIEDEVCKWLKEDGVREKIMFNTRLAVLEKVVEKNTQRVAELGEWPGYIKRESLLERIPNSEREIAPGFDAGVACALGLIPENKQELAAKLHANYSLESVEQVRHEIELNDPDSPTTWWLAACSVCDEGNVDSEKFLKQVEEFKELASDPEKRLMVAKAEFEKMTSSFEIVNGVPFGTEDGCMQGAYLAGYKYAVMYAKEYDVHFVGTYLPSLGLPEDFPWSDEMDELKRPKSGPVYNSKQFVKCANEAELEMVLREIQNILEY